MDVIEFAKEWRRICDKYECVACPLGELQSCRRIIHSCPEKAVRIVEEWSKAHPVQTNAMKFEEVFGFLPLKRGARDKNCRKHDEWCPADDCIDCALWWDEPYKGA